MLLLYRPRCHLSIGVTCAAELDVTVCVFRLDSPVLRRLSVGVDICSGTGFRNAEVRGMCVRPGPGVFQVFKIPDTRTLPHAALCGLERRRFIPISLCTSSVQGGGGWAFTL